MSDASKQAKPKRKRVNVRRPDVMTLVQEEVRGVFLLVKQLVFMEYPCGEAEQLYT